MSKEHGLKFPRILMASWKAWGMSIAGKHCIRISKSYPRRVLVVEVQPRPLTFDGVCVCRRGGERAQTGRQSQAFNASAAVLDTRSKLNRAFFLPSRTFQGWVKGSPAFNFKVSEFVSDVKSHFFFPLLLWPFVMVHTSVCCGGKIMHTCDFYLFISFCIIKPRFWFERNITNISESEWCYFFYSPFLYLFILFVVPSHVFLFSFHYKYQRANDDVFFLV